MFQLRGKADEYGIGVHMDGARLLNAAVAMGIEPSEILQHCDSVSLCLSKVSNCSIYFIEANLKFKASNKYDMYLFDIFCSQ